MIRHHLGIATFTLLLLFLCFTTVTGQENITDTRNEKLQLEKEIRSLEAKVRQTDSLILHEKKQSALLKKRLNDGIEQKKKAIAALQDKLAALDSEIAGMSGMIESTRAKSRAITARRAFLTTQLIEHCHTLEKSIDFSLPWNREQRLARATALRTDLESGAATIEDGFSRFIALLAEETTFGDEIVLETRTIERKDGTPVNARVLRMGNLWMAYVDASEEFYGILSRENDSTFTWNEDLDFSQREQVRTAIRVKESKKAPAIVQLPVTIATEQATEDHHD